MTVKRLLIQVRMLTFIGDGYKRAEYARKKDLFEELGDHVHLMSTIPLYPKLVRIHNNVVIHRSVKLVTHDYINRFLNTISDTYHYKHEERLTPIEIMDNVYIGMNTVIFGNVKIGPNVIIQSGSLVISDVPPNSVVAGVPAKVVGKLDVLMKSRMLTDKSTNFSFQRVGNESSERIDGNAVKNAWKLFDMKKNQKK